MAYGPHTPEDRARMLKVIGVDSVDDLFADIPETLRASGLRLPPPESESELSAHLLKLAGACCEGSSIPHIRRISRRSARARSRRSTSTSRSWRS
jgi:glycine cleavage system pyridoxal-binding protein P